MASLRGHHWITAAGAILLMTLCWVAIMMVKPPRSQAFTLIEMPVFTFNPVEISGNQVGEVCAVNWGDGSLNALIGLLDVTDTTKAISPVMSVELKQHSSQCFALPAVQRPTTAAATVAWTLPFLAVRKSPAWTSNQRNLTVSLQVLDGGSTKFVAPSTFLPAVQVPAP